LHSLSLSSWEGSGSDARVTTTVVHPTFLVITGERAGEIGAAAKDHGLTVRGGCSKQEYRMIESADERAIELSAAQSESDAADLSAGLGSLAGLVAGAIGLDELLTRVATFAVGAIPGADGAGVTLLRTDRADAGIQALVASAPFVSVIDDIQYNSVKEGPCITAAAERRTVRSGSLGGEQRWPRFGPRVGRLGVHSVLSLPLLIPDQVVGAINVYAHGKDAFDDHAAALGELFAAPAAVAVHNAYVLDRALILARQLQSALETRPAIDQAIGLLRGRTGGSVKEAFANLVTISQKENVKVTIVAQRIVDESVRRARARHASS
jgi:GAF domain-containing protein